MESHESMSIMLWKLCKEIHSIDTFRGSMSRVLTLQAEVAYVIELCPLDATHKMTVKPLEVIQLAHSPNSHLGDLDQLFRILRFQNI
jgi:hypothetical protein